MQDDHSFSNESGRAARKLTTIAKVIVMYIGRPLLSDRSGRPARRTTTTAKVVVLRAGLPLLGQIWPFTSKEHGLGAWRAWALHDEREK